MIYRCTKINCKRPLGELRAGRRPPNNLSNYREVEAKLKRNHGIALRSRLGRRPLCPGHLNDLLSFLEGEETRKSVHSQLQASRGADQRPT